jgi:predicted ArsR family transcriptional regulator
MPEGIGSSPRFPPASGDVTLDARNLRGLAHPVRVRLLWLLREEGPSTATRVAERLGLNTGTTSYHLRQLQSYGFVAEEEGRGNRRERWWRAVHQRTRLGEAGLLDGEAGEMTETVLRSVAALHADGMQRAIDERRALPEAWRAASRITDLALRLTAAELGRLVEEVVEVVSRYRPDDAGDAPDGSAPVRFQLQAFPRPGALRGDDP